jgi:hypothetical protein
MMISERTILYQVFFVLVFVLLLNACQTERLILVRNSASFDNTDPATIGNRDKKPSWVNDRNYQDPADGNFYAVGISDKRPFTGLPRWSEQQASAEAVSNAQIKIAEHIQVDL